MKRWVDLIDDTNSRYPLPYPESRKILGCLGADLRRMSTLGAPVPLGFTVTTEAYIEYRENGETFPEDFLDQVIDAITILGMKSEKSFGDSTKPLLLIWNTSIPIHSPGMIGPIKYIGLNDDTAAGLASMTNNPREVFYDYCEFITNFSSEIYGIEPGEFEGYLTKYMESKGYQYQPEIPASDWRSIANSYKGIFKNSTGLDFPQGPYEQLWIAIDTGFRKWIEKAESEQGNQDGVTHKAGLAQTFRVAVFGKMPRSGIGHAVTRNPETGSKEILGGYIKDSELPNWITQPQGYAGLDELKKEFPVAYKELIDACEIIEKYYRDMVRLTFVMEKEKLWVVNSTVAERSPKAAVKIAVDFLDEGLIIKPEVVPMVSPGQLKFLYLPQFSSDSQAKPIAEARGSFPGAGSGALAFTAKEVIELVGKGKKVIFITPGYVEESSVLFDNRRNISGIITSEDRELSDAARIAETLVVPCIRVPNLKIDPDKKTATMPGGFAFRLGDSVTINGATGAIYLGELPLVYVNPHEDRHLLRFESIISSIDPNTLFSETVNDFEELKKIISKNSLNVDSNEKDTGEHEEQISEEIELHDKEIADLILEIRSNPFSPDYYTYLGNRYSILGKKWHAGVHYLAFLDFSRRGKKAKDVKRKLAQIQAECNVFDVKGWLLGSEMKYIDYIEQMGSSGKKLGQKIIATTNKDVNKDVIIDGLQSWLKDVAPHKAQEWAGDHFENALNLANKSKYRAGIAQLITGIEINPHDHAARCMLAGLFASIGDKSQASDILDLVDIEKCEPIVRQTLIDEVDLVRTMINS